jgi:hypothetical protein
VILVFNDVKSEQAQLPPQSQQALEIGAGDY